MRIICIAVILFLQLTQFIIGQSTDQSPEPDARPELLQEVFNQHLPDLHIRKIYGRPYFFAYPKTEDHQFFKSNLPTDGIIFTVDDTIHSANVLYDLCTDRLIIWEPSARAFIELEEEFILGFRICDNTSSTIYEFINTVPKNDSSGVRSDIYQVLYKGEYLQIFKKHKKIYSKTIDHNKVVIRFKKREYLILNIDSANFRIQRNRDVWKLYEYARLEIKRYFRDNGIKIQYASDDQIRKTGLFLDEVTSHQQI